MPNYNVDDILEEVRRKRGRELPAAEPPARGQGDGEPPREREAGGGDAYPPAERREVFAPSPEDVYAPREAGYEEERRAPVRAGGYGPQGDYAPARDTHPAYPAPRYEPPPREEYDGYEAPPPRAQRRAAYPPDGRAARGGGYPAPYEDEDRRAYGRCDSDGPARRERDYPPRGYGREPSRGDYAPREDEWDGPPRDYPARREPPRPEEDYRDDGKRGYPPRGYSRREEAPRDYREEPSRGYDQRERPRRYEPEYAGRGYPPPRGYEDPGRRPPPRGYEEEPRARPRPWDERSAEGWEEERDARPPAPRHAPSPSLHAGSRQETYDEFRARYANVQPPPDPAPRYAPAPPMPPPVVPASAVARRTPKPSRDELMQNFGEGVGLGKGLDPDKARAGARRTAPIVGQPEPEESFAPPVYTPPAQQGVFPSSGAGIFSFNFTAQDPAYPAPPEEPGAPSATYAPPAQGYAPPAQGYAPPAQDYAPPAQGYAPPAQGYAPPAREYAPPAQDYAPPVRDYTPPAQDYAPPVRDYTPPVREYAPPAQDYAPPVQDYAPPAREYAPPARDYTLPEREYDSVPAHPAQSDAPENPPAPDGSFEQRQGDRSRRFATAGFRTPVFSPAAPHPAPEAERPAVPPAFSPLTDTPPSYNPSEKPLTEKASFFPPAEFSAPEKAGTLSPAPEPVPVSSGQADAPAAAPPAVSARTAAPAAGDAREEMESDEPAAPEAEAAREIPSFSARGFAADGFPQPEPDAPPVPFPDPPSAAPDAGTLPARSFEEFENSPPFKAAAPTPALAGAFRFGKVEEMPPDGPDARRPGPPEAGKAHGFAPGLFGLGPSEEERPLDTIRAGEQDGGVLQSVPVMGHIALAPEDTQDDAEFDEEGRPAASPPLEEERQSVAAEIKKIRMGLNVRFLLTAAGFLTLLYFGLSYLIPEVPTLRFMWAEGETMRTFLIVNILIVAASMLVNSPTIGGGLVSMCTGRADGDSLVSLAMLSCVAQGVALIITPRAADYTAGVHLYFSVPVLGLLFNLLGKMMMMHRISAGSRVAYSENAKYAMRTLKSEDFARELTRGMPADLPEITYAVKTKSVGGFLRASHAPDYAERLNRVLVFICLAASVAVAAVSYIISEERSIYLSLSVLSALLCVCAPFTTTLVGNLPMMRAALKLQKNGAAIAGYPVVEEYSDVKAITFKARDLFPGDSITMSAMKVFQEGMIEQAILDAASVICATDSPFAPIFTGMVGANDKILKPVDNIVYEDGMGLSAWVDGKRVLIGNSLLMHNHNITTPSREYETRYAGEGREILYLSNSGELIALFSMSYTADRRVAGQMRELAENGVSLVVHTTDPHITGARVASLFGYPEQYVRIVPANLHADYDRVMKPRARVNASVVYTGAVLGMFRALGMIPRVKASVTAGTACQLLEMLIGYAAVTFLAFFAGMGMLAFFILLGYQLLWAAVIIAASCIRKI